MRGFLSCLIVLVVAIGSAQQTWASQAEGTPCGLDKKKCLTDGDGAYVGMTRAQTAARIGEKPPMKKRHHDSPVSYEYTTFADCNANAPGTANTMCRAALTACEPVKDARGPMVRIFRRVVYNHGKPGHWEQVGTTCYTDLIPDQSQHLTIDMIKDAWSHTAFAKPEVATQPKGGTTLVHLKTYFAVNWPQVGFAPDEVNTVTLLGHQVRIKPTLKRYDYALGDGRHIGPTTSPGGPWPHGDITTSYDKPGHYPTRVTVTYGGQFSVDGSDWGDIPGTLDIAGPVHELTVRTAPSRLVNR